MSSLEEQRRHRLRRSRFGREVGGRCSAHMIRAAGATVLLITLLAVDVNAQTDRSIKVGWILATGWEKTGRDATPLRENGGDGSFVNEWTVLAEARVDRRLSVFAEVQSVRGISFGLYGLSAVYRVREDGLLQAEFGKFLAPFGNFLARHWASENPLIEYPLPYRYRTAISATQLPRIDAELLSVRGQGQKLHYPDLGALGKRSALLGVQSEHIPRPDWGLKVISRDVYPTGVQLFGSTNRFSYALAITNGAMSNPVDVNNTDGVQLAGRLQVTLLMGLDLGTSFASAPYLSKDSVQQVLSAAGLDAEAYRQWVWSGDLSYSRGHAVFYAETVFNRWQTPFLGSNLDVWGGYVEAKYTLTPRLFVAGRWSRLSFSKIADPSDIDGDGRLQEPWDYDVRQIELGAGYRLSRNSLLKAGYEFNRTIDMPGGDPSDDLLAFQAVVFF